MMEQAHALAAPALAHQGDCLAGGHIKGEVLEDLEFWAGGVVEMDVLQLDVALH